MTPPLTSRMTINNFIISIEYTYVCVGGPVCGCVGVCKRKKNIKFSMILNRDQKKQIVHHYGRTTLSLLNKEQHLSNKMVHLNMIRIQVSPT